jgi:mRNA interferase MazF
MVIRRGEIWWAELPEPRGSEPGYRRPVLIIQSDEFNASRIGTVLTVILTSNLEIAAAPGNVLVARRKSKLPKDSVANVSQVYTVDRSFLRSRISTLPQLLMERVDAGLKLVMALGS